MPMTRRRFVAWVALAALAGCAPRVLAPPSPVRPAPARPVALSGLRVLTGATGADAELRDAAVLCDQGRILWIGPSGALDAPAGTRVLDYSGQGATCLPGLVDAHCHREWSPQRRREDQLLHGVTAQADLGCPLTAMEELGRTATDNGQPAPRSAFAGPVIALPGGYPAPMHGERYALAVTSQAQAEDAVRRLADAGASLVKIAFEPGWPGSGWPLFPLDYARAVVRQAHRMELPVRCHVEDAAVLHMARETGVDGVEHVPLRWTGGANLRDPYPLVAGRAEPAPEIDAELAALARAGVVLTPTLSVAVRSVWDPSGPLSAAAAFARHGGRLAVGTDAPYLGVAPGSAPLEAGLLARAGVDPDHCLRAATSHAADISNLRAGRIGVGARADLLVVEGDPRADMAALARPLAVVLDGRVELGG